MNFVEQIFNTIVSFAFRIWPRPIPDTQLLRNVKLVAHRGVHEENLARENSIEAFRVALRENIWAVELDVRFTRDYIPVIHHDPHCGRLFDHPQLVISSTNYEELKSKVDVPRLSEIAHEFGAKIHLMIEIKEDLTDRPECIKNFMAALAHLRPVRDFHLLSLTPSFLEPLKIYGGEAMLDVIWLDAKGVINENRRLGHGNIAGHFLFFNESTISALKAENKKIGVGFIDSKNSLFRELGRGIDFIFTNHPLRLARIIQKNTQV